MICCSGEKCGVNRSRYTWHSVTLATLHKIGRDRSEADMPATRPSFDRAPQ